MDDIKSIGLSFFHLNTWITSLSRKCLPLLYTKKKFCFKSYPSFSFLGREDSNLRMAEPKPAALPLGDAPIIKKKLCLYSI